MYMSNTRTGQTYVHTYMAQYTSAWHTV